MQWKTKTVLAVVTTAVVAMGTLKVAAVALQVYPAQAAFTNSLASASPEAAPVLAVSYGYAFAPSTDADMRRSSYFWHRLEPSRRGFQHDPQSGGSRPEARMVPPPDASSAGELQHPAIPTAFHREPLDDGQRDRYASLGPQVLAPQVGRPPRGLQTSRPVVRIKFDMPTLAPMAHTRFCLEYRTDCKVRKIIFRGGALKLTTERRAELVQVNAEVNRAIAWERNDQGLAGEKWLISPKAGDCNDYAVTKRHELLARGWPARALLLAEVVTSWGEHHLILVVRTNEGDMVADSLNANIRHWSKTPYQWVRIQSPTNPMYWSTVASIVVG